MTFDVSQVFIATASAVCTTIIGIAAWQLRRHTIKTEKAAARRERKQEMHYRKLDAVIYALASASENISGAAFKRNYEMKLEEFTREDEFMNAIE